jgi:hypothetical protein
MQDEFINVFPLSVFSNDSLKINMGDTAMERFPFTNSETAYVKYIFDGTKNGNR